MANESQSRMARRKQKKQKKKPVAKSIFLFFFIVALIAFLSIGSLFTYYVTASPSLDAQQLSDPASTRVYDKDGNIFAELGTEQRTKITYNELPEVLIDAVIATEDARFFSHMGIDPKRIGGAILANITDGFGSEGASTITQQVIKGSFLSPEKTIKRKVQEQWLAIRLDSKYSKEEILEMYLNKIYYGNRSYGVAKAAENYFGKTDLSSLTLPEAALLAGLPQRPSAYDPTVNPDLAQERMNTVLKLMVDHGKITEEEAEEARKVEVESLLVEKAPEAEVKYEAFIQQVQKEASEKFDIDIYNDGVEIHTTLNPLAQEQVEFLLSNSEENPIVYPDGEFQAGVTVLDTNNGSILAIGGGRKQDDTQGGWNYAIDGEGRQAGSTFKPITAYGPAIETNQWSTYQQIEDAPYEKGNLKIRNWNRQHQGWVTMRHALRDSLNVPAIKTLEETGFDNAQSFAEGLGIEFADDQIALTDAIGGAATSVTPLELAGAYSAFGNEGIYNEPYAITSVVYSDGRTEEFKPEPVAAMREYTAYMITDMLKTVVTEGTGTAANVPGLSMAGKTGTTNLENAEGSPDAWFSGYTTNYTIAVWTGYGNPKAIPDSGLKIAQNIFQQTMSKISQGIDTPDFAQPDSVIEIAVEKGTNPAKLPSSYTPSSNIVNELFVAGTEPDSKSQRFDQIDPVSGLRASYNEESGSLKVTWNYSGNANFKVRGGNGSLSDITTTSNTSIEIPNVETGSTYTVEVTAVSSTNGSNLSNPVTATVNIPEPEPLPEPEIEEEDSEEQVPDEQTEEEQPNEEDSSNAPETGNENEENNNDESSGEEETEAQNQDEAENTDEPSEENNSVNEEAGTEEEAVTN